MQILNYCVGVDIAKDKFDCCLSQIDINRVIHVVSRKVFSNKPKGFIGLMDWIVSMKKSGIQLTFVMEATGIYYENLAHYIFSNSVYPISVLLPTKAKYYFKSLNIKTKTDKIDAELLSRYGLERRTKHWEPINRNIRMIKQLSREFRDLKIQLNRLKNRLHAKQHSFEPNPLVIKLLNQSISLAENQCLNIEVELKQLFFEDHFLSEKLDKICTIPGVGFMTAVTIVAETNGFALIKNAKQLCSYAGLDVKQNNSGNKTGKSKISKQGNRYIRQALYMPALSASKYIKPMSGFYQRINKKNKCKKVGLIGVARKLLILIYTLWRKDENFDLQYN